MAVLSAVTIRRTTSPLASVWRGVPSAVRALIARQKRISNALMRRSAPGTNIHDGFEDHYQNTAVGGHWERRAFPKCGEGSTLDGRPSKWAWSLPSAASPASTRAVVAAATCEASAPGGLGSKLACPSNAGCG
eukprot:447398-Pyramimonas_sp.AAC.1